MRERPRLGRRRERLRSEPDFSHFHKAAIEYAIHWAWMEVLSQSPGVVQSGREEQITECMERVLNEQDPITARRRAPGMQDFETVGRGAKVTTADGRIEKAPDLVFRLVVGPGVRHRGDWGMFVECKIVAPERNHSPEAYCANGLAKFACGEYAPRMRSGLMIAYVRDGRRPFEALAEPLKNAYSTVLHKRGPSIEESLSCHDRSKLQQPCVQITVTHLWLDASVQ